MEVEEIERQQQQKNPSKFSRVGSNRNESTKLCHHYGENNQEEDGLDLIKRPNYSNPLNNGVNDGNNNNINSIISSSINDRLCGWHHSSRIIRVSRASGGKDRHSKVWTSKGLRDRRVRLSVTTAIQFYDLQDRLGFDQPSKAVEWLIKAAADSIAELPKLNSSFPLETSLSCQLSDDQKRREQLEAPLDSGEADVDNVEQESNQQGLGLGQQQHGSLMSKSACSSTSETSKGSGLSLSRGDTRVNRVKARERARERTAKEKEKEKEKESELNRVNSNVQQHQHQNISHMSQNSTFTELLTAGISNSNHHSGSGESGSPNDGSTEVTLFHKVAAAAAASARQWPLTTMDCFGGSGMLGGTPAASGRTGFPGQIQLGNSLPQGMTMSMLVPQQPTPFSISIGGYNNSNNSHHHHHHHHHHQLEQLQHFPFVPDLILPVAAATGSGGGGGGGQGGDYNLNFTISSSSGLAAGFNRGTLQSNSSSPTSSPQHSISTHLQRFSSASANAAASSSPMDGSTNNIPFFIDTSATTTTAMENHHNHQHHHQFPPGLQLLYGDGRHSDHKGKGKS